MKSGVVFTILFLFNTKLWASVDESLRVVESNENSIIIELTVPELKIEALEYEGTVYHRLDIRGFGVTRDVGRPQLPFKGSIINIPLEGDISIEILDYDYRILSGYNVYPSPQPIIIDNDKEGKKIGFEFTIDRDAYYVDTFLPQEIVKESHSDMFRGQHVAHLLLLSIVRIRD